jgi:hypothetical protein
VHVLYRDTFFATAATIIPVLLLALSLQGDFIARMFIGMIKALAASLRAQPTRLRDLPRALIVTAIHSFRSSLYSIGFFGVFGTAVAAEFVAIGDLATGGASPDQARFVLTATLILIVGTAVAVMLRLVEDPRVKAAFKDLRQSWTLHPPDDDGVPSGGASSDVTLPAPGMDAGQA